MLAWIVSICVATTIISPSARADEATRSDSDGPSSDRRPDAGNAPTKTPVSFAGAPAGYRSATTWDLNLEGAVGSTLGRGSAWTGFGRARFGALVIRDANVFAFGVTYECSTIQPATFGAQVEYMNDNSGLWVQAGPLIDIQPRLGVMLGAGYSLVGVEAQLRSYEPTGATFAVYAKIRIPIGFIAYEIRQ